MCYNFEHKTQKETPMSKESELFKLIDSRNYTQAFQILNAYSHESSFNVNTVDDKGFSFLYSAIIQSNGKAPGYYSFIEALLANPQFNLVNTPYAPNKRTPFAAAVFGDCPELVKVFLKYRQQRQIEVIYSEGNLLFQKQTKAVNDMAQDLEEDPEDELTIELLAKQKEILAILRDLTIRHAVSTDNPEILQTMVGLGDAVYRPLLDGVTIIELTQTGSSQKVGAWLDSYLQKNKTNPLYQEHLAQQQLKCLDEDVVAQKQQLIEKHIAEQKALISSFFKLPSSSPSAQDKPASSSPSPK